LGTSLEETEMANNASSVEDLVVRLLGDGSSYSKMLNHAMALTQKAEKEFARMGSVLSDLKSRIESIGTSVQNVGRRIRNFGTSLSLSMTLPLLGIGTATTKAFGDFDKAMTESTSVMSV